MDNIMKSLRWLLLCCPLIVFGQGQPDLLKGRVAEVTSDGDTLPLIGANVYWLDGTTGTSTDVEGRFELQPVEQTEQLVISYIGYQSDTIDMQGRRYLQVVLNSSVTLEEVKVTGRKRSTEISFLNPMKVEKIGEEELTKAACCNLSESFETNPSVDVSFTDAITGTRQIRMLGLAGPYTQITREIMPDARGLASVYGLLFTPGPWIESMQLAKGMGSVSSGFESIAGQINVELRKPENMDRLYLNAYGNQAGRVELNAMSGISVSEKVSTGILLHGMDLSSRHDRNGDSFMDQPLSERLIGINRWKFRPGNGWNAQAGIKGVYIDSKGGQEQFESFDENQFWGFRQDHRQLLGWAKAGKVFEHMPWKSFGLQISASSHEMDSRYAYGDRRYDALHRTAYVNAMYQSILSNTWHEFKMGLNFQYDHYTEVLNDASEHIREERVPGVFFEYARNTPSRLDLIAGIRADHHNRHGLFITPRLHLRYSPVDQIVLRASAGRGWRTALPLAENGGVLASSRAVYYSNEMDADPYQIEELDAEVAWNYGFNGSYTFRMAQREGILSLDLYRTDFTDQIIMDLEDPREVRFYNLEGESFANSLQLQLDYELIDRLDMRVAYRYYDVKATVDGQLLQRAFTSHHRAFINLAYSTNSGWAWDGTLQWQGEKRIPETEANPAEFQLDEYSPDFFVLNTQVSKKWDSGLEIYLGAENLLDYTQDDPILAADNPQSEYFDASMIWGPVFGRKVYLGARYRLK